MTTTAPAAKATRKLSTVTKAPAKTTTAKGAPAKKTASTAPTAAVKVPPAKGTAKAPASTPGKPARIDHSTCSHPRTFAGRGACRAAHRKAAACS